MMRYLHAPENTRERLRDGSYVTGDIDTIAADGFIRLTDRWSRFSTIAGEMVPHVQIEEAITQMLGDAAACVVTAIPDDSKGERLVALYEHTRTARDAVVSQVRVEPPTIWILTRATVYGLEAIPLRGSRTVALKKVRWLALDMTRGMTMPQA